jgi:hypothetical protein
MLGADLADVCGVTTRTLKQAVRQNADRFPEDYAFRLTAEEKSELIAKYDHLSRLKFSPSLPLAFTVDGAIGAATMLKPPPATELKLSILNLFRDVPIRGRPRSRGIGLLKYRQYTEEALKRALLRELSEFIKLAALLKTRDPDYRSPDDQQRLDLFILFSSNLGDVRWLEAAERIRPHIGTMHGARLKVLRRVLKEECGSKESSPGLPQWEEAFRVHQLTCLPSTRAAFLRLPLRKIESLTGEEISRLLAKAIESPLTESILGPDWRHLLRRHTDDDDLDKKFTQDGVPCARPKKVVKKDQAEQDDQGHKKDEDDFDRIFSEAELMEILSDVGATSYESKALEARLEKKPWKEVTAAIGKNPAEPASVAAARKAGSRAKMKIRSRPDVLKKHLPPDLVREYLKKST